MKLNLVWKFVITCSLLIFIIGCGSNTGPERYQVSGTVTLDGDRVDAGQIMFNPKTTDSKNAPTANGFIKDGKFTIHRKVGAIAGPQRVEIKLVEVSEPPSSSGQSTDDEEEEIEVEETTLGSLVTDIEISDQQNNVFEFEFTMSDLKRPQYE